MARVTALTALLLVSGLVACGGGEGDDGREPPPRPAPPRDEYVEALDEACREAGEVQGSSRPGGEVIGGGSVRRFVRELRRRNDAGRLLVARAEQIAPPPEHRRFHRRYIAVVSDQIALTERMIAAVRARDDAAYRRLTERLGRVLVRRNDLLARSPADLEHCGQP